MTFYRKDIDEWVEQILQETRRKESGPICQGTSLTERRFPSKDHEEEGSRGGGE